MVTMVDPFALEILDDPYDTYAKLRSEAPLYKVPHLDLHLVLSHGAVMEAIARVDDFSNNLTAFFMIDDAGKQIMVDAARDGGVDVLATADDPFHLVHRRALNRPFSEKRMLDVQDELRSMVGELIEAHLPAGTIEWVHGVSSVLPIRAIAMLLGLPDDDSERLKFWSDEAIEVLSGFADGARMAECIARIDDFVRYLGIHMDAALERAHIGAEPMCVIDTVARAEIDGDYDRHTSIGLLIQLVGAGSDSTTGLTGSCALALATHPDVQATLRAQPSLIPAFVEEVLRLETPFRGHFRHVIRSCQLGDVDLRKDDRVLLMWSSANRDPAMFEDPDALRLDRPTAKNHLGFGWGIHHCIGAPLARLEARLAVEELLARTSAIALDRTAPPPSWVPSLFLRRLASLPLTVAPA
ncbi:MAG: cytochrome P450 [Actinobacteria bacterium]|nr:MAG: cytochrome P450 [Actinomycetota bacterium]